MGSSKIILMAALFRRVRKVFVRIFRRNRKRTFSINESSAAAKRISGAVATNNQNEIGFEDEDCPEWRYNPRFDIDLGSSESNDLGSSESNESDNFEDDCSENSCRQNLAFNYYDEVNSNEEISIIDIQR